ncbi:spore germination protein [Niallia endozanthoxylica]|uniref:Spore germination protein n=1 Tax=Niallia endozanthoxylica TaxID=2036016 RepID=A0A5J5HZJ2_9BACI|nr:spore germination protein [Niallia endozanthoxylica]KAA9028542.1 spore germination protein [Niallia endozanthoxylica]
MKRIRYRKIMDLIKNDVRKEEKPVTADDQQNVMDIQLDKNIDYIKTLFGKSEDVKYRELEVVTSKKHHVFLCFIDGLVNESYINLHIIKSLLEPDHTVSSAILAEEESGDFLTIVESRILSSLSVKKVQAWNKVTDSIMLGETLLLVDGYETGLLISTQGFAARNVGEPDTESSVRGPREGFNEVLKVNTSLIRRKINNPHLVFEGMKIGKQTKTNIRIGYIDGIANPKVVNEVKKRLKNIDTDSILESGYIEQFIEDHPYSIFPTVANSEKPDKVAAKILEGRVAILCDGTPFVLTVPHLFVENLQVGEDYYSRPYLSSLIRLLRLLSLFLTVASPSVYIALTTYHHEMVPALLLTTMAAAEEKVPFPTFIEAIIMAIVFEILREAGVRMPRPVGAAISIVGALVIGEAAVTAGFVSAPMVIVIAITGICGFVVSSLNDAIILSRFLLIFLAGALGLYGILMGFLMLLGHLCSLRSFGSPFLSPQAPIFWSGWADSIIRMPLWLHKSRPQSVVWRESKRQSNHNKPTRPDTEGEEQS